VRRGLITAVGALCLAAALFSIINRGPFFFADTTAYVRAADASVFELTGAETAWSDRLRILQGQNAGTATLVPRGHSAVVAEKAQNRVTVLAGRSIYYGMFLYISDRVWSLWLAVLVQSLVVAIALVLSSRLLAPNIRIGQVIGLAVITALSGVSAFTGLLMPDIFAALAILACAIVFSFWDDIGSSERVFWWSLLAAGTLTHSATILIITVIFIVVWIASRRPNKVILVALIIGAIGELFFALAVKHYTGAAPIRPPFLSARLIDDGPGQQFLARHCPDSRWVLCDFYHKLPDGSDPMLWNSEGTSFMTVDPFTQRAWSREDLYFSVSVVADNPVEAVAALGRAILRQATSLSLRDVTQPSVNLGRVPETKRSLYLQTLASRGSFDVLWWDRILLFLVLSSILIFIVRAKPMRKKVSSAVLIVALGIVADVAICGAISTPHDRYLTRVVWLLPVLAYLALLSSTIDCMTRGSRLRLNEKS
jgi:hypothetical protein